MSKHLYLFFFSALSLTQPLQSVAAKPVLSWCLDNFKGFHEFIDEYHQAVGPSVNLMLYLSEQIGVDLKMSPPTPPSRCFELLRSGEADVMTNLLYKPERAEFLDFIVMAERYPESLIMLADDLRDISTAKQLQSLNIATIRGHRYTAQIEAVLANNPTNGELHMQSLENALLMLRKKRIDAILSPTVVSATLLDAQPDKNQFQLVQLPAQFTDAQLVHIGVSKHTAHPELAKRLAEAIEQAKVSGVFKQLYDQEKIDQPLKSLPPKNRN
ncbi:substrate-binding periplasmic protein [Pseudoalteromonas fenneropenaei]|uniref:Substrate-binding periplasmic protein n=1 Tax=Pseudoalteromonas fenneropenaei TaxID=1737459 RepID=A0ABV7CNF1_9GAMM